VWKIVPSRPSWICQPVPSEGVRLRPCWESIRCICSCHHTDWATWHSENNDVTPCNLIHFYQVHLFYWVLLGKPEGKRQLGRPRCKWEDNIKTVPKRIEWSFMDWIYLAQGRFQRRALVITVVNSRFPKNARKLFSSLAISGFLRRAQLRGVRHIFFLICYFICVLFLHLVMFSVAILIYHIYMLWMTEILDILQYYSGLLMPSHTVTLCKCNLPIRESA
jgi:hypothetical protein